MTYGYYTDTVTSCASKGGSDVGEDGRFKNAELEERYQLYENSKNKLGEMVRDRNDWLVANETFDVIKQQGRDYEIEKFNEFKNSHTEAQEQVKIRTTADNGTVYVTIVDGIGFDTQDNLVIQEYKSSQTAPLTANQRDGFPIIKEKGGIVISRGKGPVFTSGYEIPPGTVVDVLRKK